MSIPSSITWRTLPNSGGRTYILLSDLSTILLLQYFLPGTTLITAGYNLLSGSQFISWITSYVFSGGWDPVNSNNKHVFILEWKALVASAIEYVTPTLTAGQAPEDTITVQIAQLLYDQFGDTPTLVALATQS